METTFLTKEQIWGDDQGKGQLQVIKSYGTKTGMSDLVIVLGGLMGGDKTSDGQKTRYLWSASLRLWVLACQAWIRTQTEERQ